ncbi:hypothetical protein LTR27_010925 [Elasticomyces elasticus]|nr:hypothetical protein LTR27_010925 [Elasticomyces elasticus]
MADPGNQQQQQQVAAAEYFTKPGHRADESGIKATGEPQRQSKLLSIAPELRNAIYELSVTGLTCTVQIESFGSGKPHPRPHTYAAYIARGAIWRFDLGLPAFYYACRSTRDEFPLSQFYANNTFVFNDSTMERKVLDAFMSTCPEAVKAIRSIKVKISRENVAIYDPTGQIFDVSFALCKLDSGEVKVKDLCTTAKKNSEHDAFGLCLCDLLRLAEEGTQQNHSPVVVLRAFLALCDDPDAPIDRFDWYLKHERPCPGCDTPELRAASG